MNDFSMASISKLVIHLIGNQAKEEELMLSSDLSLISDDVTEQYLKQFFFSSFKFDLAYQFMHESDITLNEVYNYASKIFQNKNNFLLQSVNIAKHLYEVSTHPNIKKGELYVSYITGCIFDGIKTDIIGIFKSETKDFYLNAENKNNIYDVSCMKGINTSKLDKGCLILDMGSKYPQKLFIVDMNRNDSLYWKKLFLKVEEISDEYTSTSAVLKTCKQFVKKDCDVKPTEKISLLNNSVKYFETHDSFELEDFTSSVFGNETNSEKFKTYLNKASNETNFEQPFTISPKAVTTVKKSIKNFIKLDSNIEIRIKTQVQAVEDMMEKGYDEDKKMSYYKIYYTNEE